RPLSGPEALEVRAVPAVLTVNTTEDFVDDNTVLSLREAILLVNGTFDPNGLTAEESAQIDNVNTLGTNDRIQFDLGAGIQTISLLQNNGALPALTKKVVIEGDPGIVGETCDVC